MSASEVAIVVRYQAMEEKGDEVAALLARHTAATRAEPGNLDFVALRSTEDPDAFVLYERYSSRLLRTVTRSACRAATPRTASPPPARSASPDQPALTS